ncbi:hypothetical protein BDV27DRAFT_164861 [Aspergillus caelatus]|uniref:Uncharacterized protein n=1 Tax=Aspergillus caelatus TaxID=61420 RepID=A0A5N6ZHE1_9EURO|nr:uncharacterized protein BDV27DRAFT_164861 [Aspergillus caelatus]KAE8357087.1 hypothetical protein BDV27DRAFT_164861 [Aspergillus caelatus]
MSTNFRWTQGYGGSWVKRMVRNKNKLLDPSAGTGPGGNGAGWHTWSQVLGLGSS